MNAAVLVAFSLALQAATLLLSPMVSPIYDLLLVPLAVAIGLAGLTRQDRNAPWLVFTLAVLILAQFGRWHGGDSEFMILAGRIPNGDAKDYMAEAIALLNGHPLTPVTAKRPLFVLALTALLRLTGQNLAMVMAILTLCNGLALSALITVVRRLHGGWAAAAVFLLCYFYYRRFIGIPLTEHVGFALGCLGTALLLRAAIGRSLTLAWAGTLLMALALTARAGAMVLMAVLPLWTCWLMAPRGRRAMVIAILGGSVAVALPLLLNRWLSEAYGQASVGFNNFSYTLYGVLHGGTWTQAFTDHPELRGLSEYDRTNIIMAMAMDTLRSEPWRLISGTVRAWANALTPHKGLFSFIYTYPDAFNELVNDYLARGIRPALASIPDRLGDYHWLNMVLDLLWQGIGWIGLITGIAAAWRMRRPQGVLLLGSMAALALSLPFAPPWDADFMRVYGATIPLLAVLVGLGAARMARVPEGQWPGGGRVLWQPALAVAALSAAALPWAHHSLALPAPGFSCPGGGTPVTYRAVGGTWAGSAAETGGISTLDPARMQASLHTLGLIGSPWENPLRQAAGSTIGVIYDGEQKTTLIVQTDDGMKAVAKQSGCLYAADGQLPRLSAPPE